jgi:RsiW-degrading membrane proteinase PrsW (M82 family)
MVSGIVLGIFEILFIFIGGYIPRHFSENLKQMNVVSYYWFVITIVTGVLWETSYLVNYIDVGNYSHYLINNNQTVWTNEYDFIYVLPNKFAYIFYATYAAWGDREYMSTTDDWSRVVESSHAFFCGCFAACAIYNQWKGNKNELLITMAISMGSQIMNSLLYMVEYFIQMDTPQNINFNNASFPAGTMLSERPFMWINIFWLIFPTYTLVYYLLKYSVGRERFLSNDSDYEKGPILLKDD